MDVRTVEATIHGRFLYVPHDPQRLLVGFHGYAERAEIHLEEIQKIPGSGQWSLVSVQGLRTFYTRGGEVVANWMTSQDRELAIADNLAYVGKVLASLPKPKTLVFSGFSQGVAMAFRAAAHFPSAGVIALGGDVPPDVVQRPLPRVLLARGVRDEWYTDEKMKADLSVLRNVTPLVFDGGHEFSDAFRAAAGEFLSALS
jgi:dienelactone hydrolase